MFGFDPGSVLLGSVVDKVTLAQGFYRLTSVCCLGIISVVPHIN